MQAITKLLGKNRLVTLTGSGGVGKTRLAIQSSNKLLDKFKDGVWWIDLVGLSDPALVPQAVAKVVGVHEVLNQPLIETLVEELQTKQELLVLDNCEHLILACAQLADPLLSGTKFLKILATSREALDILGETVWLVPSLSLPGARDFITVKKSSRSESVHLFMERATVIHRRRADRQTVGPAVPALRDPPRPPHRRRWRAPPMPVVIMFTVASRPLDRSNLCRAPTW